MSNTASPAGESLAQRIIAKIFADHFKPGLDEVAFRREELVAAAEALGEPRPRNLGDIVYSLRYRVPLARPIAAQFMANDEIALFEFEESGNKITIAREKHYELVPSDQLTAEELQSYRQTAVRKPQ